MKKLSMLFAALLLAGGGVMFTGCSDDDDNKEQTGEITITTDPKSPITLDAGENEFQVNVTVTGVSTWSVAAASGQDWCTADKGNYQNRFYITTPANDTGEERSTTVTITAGDKTLPLTVTQPAAAQIYLGTYENYTGTYTMSFQSQDGSTFDITFTVAASDEMIPLEANDGSTINFKSYSISGWSYSEIGQLKPMRAIFEPDANDSSHGLMIFLCENLGDVNWQGSTQSVDVGAVGTPNAQGQVSVWTANPGAVIPCLLAAFITDDYSEMIYGGTAMSETEYSTSVVYCYYVGENLSLFGDRDLFISDGATRGNAAPATLMFQAGQTAKRAYSIPSYTRFPVQANVSMLRIK